MVVDFSHVGLTWQDKVTALRGKMAERKISWFVVTALDEIACKYRHTARCVCVFSGQITTWPSFPLHFLINPPGSALVSDVDNYGHDCMRDKLNLPYLGKEM